MKSHLFKLFMKSQIKTKVRSENASQPNKLSIIAE